MMTTSSRLGWGLASGSMMLFGVVAAIMTKDRQPTTVEPAPVPVVPVVHPVDVGQTNAPSVIYMSGGVVPTASSNGSYKIQPVLSRATVAASVVDVQPVAVQPIGGIYGDGSVDNSLLIDRSHLARPSIYTDGSGLTQVPDYTSTVQVDLYGRQIPAPTSGQFASRSEIAAQQARGGEGTKPVVRLPLELFKRNAAAAPVNAPGVHIGEVNVDGSGFGTSN